MASAWARRGADFSALRDRVRQLENGTARPAERMGPAAPAAGPSLPLGAAALDAHLPGGGLPLGGLHEVEGARAEWDDAAATGFCLALVARLCAARPASAEDDAVLWITPWRDLYAPGVATFGLDPGRLILVRAGGETDVLWAMEEALRCPRLVAVVGEVGALERAASRRLHLAARASGVTAFALHRQRYPARRAAAPSAALTRWRIAPSGSTPMSLAGRLLGRPSWQVELLRCRGAAPGQWHVEWNDATGGFALAAPVRDRSVVAAPRRPDAAPDSVTTAGRRAG